MVLYSFSFVLIFFAVVAFSSACKDDGYFTVPCATLGQQYCNTLPDFPTKCQQLCGLCSGSQGSQGGTGCIGGTGNKCTGGAGGSSGGQGGTGCIGGSGNICTGGAGGRRGLLKVYYS